MKKFLRILFVALGFLIGILAVAWLGVNSSKYVLYKDFMENKQDVCKIPALNEGFVPQGITYLDGEDAYLHSGYNGENIALYLTRGDEARTLYPLDEKGEPAKGHGGGITDAGDYIYIADSSSLLVYSRAEILAAENGSKISCVARIEVDNKASFCFASDGWMYVGEFYRAGNYETDLEHHYTTPAQDQNRAIVSRYKIKEDGMPEAQPERWISIPAQVQGFAISADGTVAVSRSWGLNSSYLEFYEMKEAEASTPYGDAVPLYYIDSSTLQKQVLLPAFSEDLELLDGRVVVTFESACNKYIIGKLFFAFEASSYPFP